MENEIKFVKNTKYKNKCDICKKDIPEGSDCYWKKGTKENYHVVCYESQEKAKSHTVSAPQIDSKSGRLVRSAEEGRYKLDYDIEKAMRESKALVDKIFGETDYSLYHTLVAEIAREKFELFIQAKIQQWKQENLEKVR